MAQLEMTDGTSMYYETAGEGQPLVLSHAAFLDSSMFDGIWDRLTQQFRVIRYDMIGFGQSGEAHGSLCRRAHLYQLLQHLNVTGAHFIGCSNGGEIMIDLALEHPELLASLTVVGSTPSGFELQGEPPPYLYEMFDAVQRGEIDRANELQIRIWFDGMFREPTQVDAELRRKAATMNRIPVQRKTFLVADMQPENPLNPPAATRLADIKCPTLIIAGALDHPEVVRAADVMAAQIPNARKVIMEGTAHVPCLEQPEKFLQLELDFLNSL